jgi:peptide/nickel transport system substrate-binding protein
VNRQPRALLSVLLIGVIGLVGWFWWSGARPDTGDGGVEIAVSEAPTRGGSVTSSLRSEPRTFNRIANAQVATDMFSLLTSSKLIRVNRATQEIEAGLAESWTVSPDNLTYTLTLRDGVVWSDGVPFTSADVLFSFDAMYDPKVGSPLGGSLTIGGKRFDVSAPDPKTVVVKLPGTFGPGLALFDNVHLMAKHKYEALLKAGRFAEAMSTSTPPAELVSLGPFKLASYTPGQRLIFERNERYWKTDQAGVQLPYLDRVNFEIVPDQNAELVRQQGGQLDLLQQPNRAEDIATLRQLEQQGRLKLIELGVSADPDPFFFNLRSPFWAKDPRREWITRKEFRHALSHAVDREAFANTIYLGAAVPVWGPVTPGNTKWFSPNIQRYGHSAERAREILAGLGLANRDADEWLEDARGTEARFTLLVFRGNTQIERGAAFIRDELRKVGIAVDVAALEQGAVVQRMLKGDFEAIHFTMAVTNLDPAMSPDFWLSSGAAHIWNIGQPTPATEWEKQIDDLMKTVTGSVDQQERKRAFEEVQKIFAEHLPAIYYVAPRLYMGVSTRVSGMRPSILRPQLLWDAEHMTVRQER